MAVKENVGHAEYGVPVSHQTQPPIPQKNYGPPIEQPQLSYGLPEPQALVQPQQNYLPPVVRPEQQYGVPDIQTSYGPPASGHAGNDNHIIQGHSDISDQDVRSSFDSAVGLVTSSLGVSGDSDVVQSNIVHESHTSEVSKDFQLNFI